MFQSNYGLQPYSGTNVSAISNFSSTSNYHHHDFEFNGFNYIPPEEIELFHNELLGNGSFGYVKKARWKGQIVAVKFQMEATQFKTEAEQLAKIKHENIITVYGHSSHNDNYVIVMEFAEGGALAALLSDPAYRSIDYKLSHAISWCLQCAKGVQYLHSMKPKPLIHRDLKPLNLLLNADGLILKICDFGTACDKKTIMTNNKGSSAWMAPEVFKGSEYSEKCDVFSWAIILWQCLSRRQPFSKYDNEYAIQWSKVALEKKPPLLRNCPSKLTFLLEQGWHTKPEQRLSMDEIVVIMEELYSHCEPATNYPLKLVPTTSVKEGKVFITNVIFNNNLNNSNSSNNSNYLNRRISDDNLVTQREVVEHKPNFAGHKRSSSYGAGVFLDDHGTSEHTTVVNGPNYQTENEEEAEAIKHLLRSFNAYLVLEERHYPGQPDIKNSESIALFEEHRQLSVKLLRTTFEIARLESYLKDLQTWNDDPNRDNAAIYMRFVDENRNLKKLTTSFIDQLSTPRQSRSNSTSAQQPNIREMEVGNGWMLVDQPTFGGTPR